MAMSEEKKKALAEHAKKKRGVLLKDLTREDLLMAVDYVQERPVAEGGPVALRPPTDSNYTDDGYQSVPCYLKYARPEQVETLASVLPHVRKILPVPGSERKTRRVVVFDGRTLQAVLKVLVGVDKAGSYFNSLPGKMGNYQDWQPEEEKPTPSPSRGGVTGSPWWEGGFGSPFGMPGD